MPKPVGRCSICGAEGPLGEPCGGEYCLGSGVTFEPIGGRAGNIESQAIAYEAKRRQEAEARKLEEDLEADVRALSGEVEGLNVDVRASRLPEWARKPWAWTLLIVALVGLAFAFGGPNSAPSKGDPPTRSKAKLSKDAQSLKAALGSCDEGKLEQCEQAARWLKKGVGAQPSPIRAQTLMEKACEGGRLNACHGLAEWLDEKTEPEAEQRARLLYQRACESGHVQACVVVAHKIRNLGADLSAARSLAQRGCDGKAYEGCYLLASMIERGEGGERSPDKAEYLYALACDEKVGNACNDLAIMLSESGDSPKAKEKARSLFVRACELKSAAGCFSVGMLHEQGDGVVPSPAKAFARYKDACGLDHGDACYRVARAYRDGLGVRKDTYRAQEFMRRACAKGSKKACR